jgi:hypothetical protein
VIKVRAGDMVMLANLGAAETGKIALRLIGAGPVRAVRAAVIDGVG